MQLLLEAFAEIFEEPKQFPPIREVEHHIPLKEGMEPIKVQPYKQGCQRTEPKLKARARLK